MRPAGVARHTGDGPRILFAATIAGTLRAFLLPFARRFQELGWRVDGLAAGISACHECVEAFDAVWDIGWARRLSFRDNVAAVDRVRQVVSQGRFDLVHVHTPVAAAVTRFALRESVVGPLRPRVVYTAHGFHFRDGPHAISHVPVRVIERFAGRWTDHLIVMNDTDERLAKRYRLVPPSRLERMPGVGVDTSHYHRAAVPSRAIDRVRTELGVQADGPLFTLVGEFSRRKRQHDAVEALAHMREDRAHLVLIGDGNDRRVREVRRLVDRLGMGDRVHLTGRVADVRPYLVASTALLSVSSREGLPRSVMEALSIGTPVIGTDTPGTSDLLRDGRGFLVPVAQPRALAAAMDAVISDPDEARSRAEAATAHIGRFDLSQVLDRHERTYGHLLAAGVRP